MSTPTEHEHDGTCEWRSCAPGPDPDVMVTSCWHVWSREEAEALLDSLEAMPGWSLGSITPGVTSDSHIAEVVRESGRLAARDSALIAKAKAEGAVEALREAADVVREHLSCECGNADCETQQAVGDVARRLRDRAVAIEAGQ